MAGPESHAITLQPNLIDEIVGHARRVYPQEACGLLAGHSGQATRFLPTPNALASETAYEIDPSLLISAFRSLRESGEELIAIVHSHPRGPAEPSKRDLERVYYPQAAHLIVSLAAPDRPQLRAFRIIDGQAYEIEVHAIL
jgi:proteasome lid subunit RPN8/RPN11